MPMGFMAKFRRNSFIAHTAGGSLCVIITAIRPSISTQSHFLKPTTKNEIFCQVCPKRLLALKSFPTTTKPIGSTASPIALP